MHRTRALTVTTLTLLLGTVQAASPPALVSYQGVLRDNTTGVPLSGSYSMVFRFYDVTAGGSPILVDTHAGASSVVVSGGLFQVDLGGGTVTDGSGPGSYTSLSQVFRDFAAVYLEVVIGGETLGGRTRVVGAPYALNASNLDGRAPSEFLDTSSTAQTKTGGVTFDANAAGAGQAGVRAYGDYAVIGQGPTVGGYFSDADGTSETRVGYSDVGLESSGTRMGGWFWDRTDPTTSVFLANDGAGIGTVGTVRGGHFVGPNFSHATLADGQAGVIGAGSMFGGQFYGSSGVQAFGDPAGEFTSSLGEAWANVGYFDWGILSSGPWLGQEYAGGGGEFAAFNPSTGVSMGRARLGIGDVGIIGYGTFAGGVFRYGNPSNYWNETLLANWDSAIMSGAPKNFAQNHPEDPSKVIVYTALEGDEAGIYTRGTARLTNGSARIALGETFRFVTNPEIGLTAFLTPRGEWSDLYVESLSPSELVVRSRDRRGNGVFDYAVLGLRIGYEELSVVREKEHDFALPPAGTLEQRYAGHPELRRYNALERFKAMATERGEAATERFPRAEALKASIGVHDPRVTSAGEKSLVAGTAERAWLDVHAPTPPVVERSAALVPTRADVAAEPPAPVHTNATTTGAPPSRSFQPTAGVRVSTPVESGDVLVVDREHAGQLAPARSAADAAVVGIVTEPGPSAQLAVGRASLAVAGIVPCKVDAGYGAIRVGDLLVTSPTLGHAMRALDAVPGTIVGKALEPLDVGTGVIQVLVLPR